MHQTNYFIKFMLLILVLVPSCKPLKGKINGTGQDGSGEAEQIPVNEGLKVSRYSTIEHLDGVLSITAPAQLPIYNETNLKNRMRTIFLGEESHDGAESAYLKEQKCINEIIAKTPAKAEKEHEIHYNAHIDLKSCLSKSVAGTFYLDINFWFFCDKGNLITTALNLDSIGSAAVARLCEPGLISVLVERAFERDLVASNGDGKDSVFKTSYKDVLSHQDGSPCLGQLLSDNLILFADGCQKTIIQTGGEESSYSKQVFKGILGTFWEPFYQSGSLTLRVNDWDGTVIFGQENNSQVLTYDLTNGVTSIQDSLKKMPVLNFVPNQKNTLSQFVIGFLP